MITFTAICAFIAFVTCLFLMNRDLYADDTPSDIASFLCICSLIGLAVGIIEIVAAILRGF